ncbi:hypothetical protein LY76DRAFT_324441 [Colletotrichum caudatum]|nr:hypothetical protein LY76DRAFT_324441 [Colletotrichum caudatum]
MCHSSSPNTTSSLLKNPDAWPRRGVTRRAADGLVHALYPHGRVAAWPGARIVVACLLEVVVSAYIGRLCRRPTADFSHIFFLLLGQHGRQGAERAEATEIILLGSWTGLFKYWVGEALGWTKVSLLKR